MKLKVPPAFVFGVHFALVWVISKYLIFATLDFSGKLLLAQILSMTGCLIALIAILTLYRAGTTIDPVDPGKASHLVSTGIFKWSRNPIYLALLLILMAWIVWKGNAVAAFMAIFFIWYMTHFQIIPEEIALEKKFGMEFSEYKSKVRRWI